MLKKYKSTREVIYKSQENIIQLKKEIVDNWILIIFLRILLFLVVVALTVWGFINIFPLTLPILGFLILVYFKTRTTNHLEGIDEIRIGKNDISKLVKDDDRLHFEKLYKFPTRNYFELVMLPKDGMLTIKLMVFGQRIVTFKMDNDDLLFFVGKLEVMLKVEIYETFQTVEKEEVMCFRSVSENYEKHPFLYKIIKSKSRIFITPYTSNNDFILNFQRDTLHTYDGYNLEFDRIQTITYRFILHEVILDVHSKNNHSFEIIRFSKGSFSIPTIHEDLRKLFDYLHEIPQLQHVQFEMKY